MSRSVSILRSFALSCALLTPVAAVLRAVALCTALDAAPGYYRAGAFLPSLVRALMVVCVAAFCALPFLLKKECPALTPAKSPAARCGAGLCGAALLAAGVFLFFPGSFTPAGLRVVAALFLLLATGYFVLRAMGKTARAVPFGFAVLAALLLCFLLTYFDVYTPMNAPHKTSLHLCLLALLLYLVYELRAALVGAPRAFSLTGLITAFLCGTVGVSNVVAFIAGVYTDVGYLFFDLLVLTAGIYAACAVGGAILRTSGSEGK